MTSATQTRTLSLFALISGAALLSACGGQEAAAPVEPVAILPDAPEPTPFTRAYELAESPDGRIRIFAQEDRDDTNLFEMRLQEDGSWGAPQMLELPHVRRITSPAFDPRDGTLYYSSDEPVEGISGRVELNLWRVAQVGDSWGEPEPLTGDINSGAIEKSPALDRDGNLYFVTDHPRAGGGGLDIMRATYDAEAGGWRAQPMPEGFNSPRADDHVALTPDGNRMFFYSHRNPKMGFVDIWTATRGEDGEWSTPVNLGAPVNTPGIDFGAGMSRDGQTLFFSREGALMAIPMEAALAGEGWTGEPEDEAS